MRPSLRSPRGAIVVGVAITLASVTGCSSSSKSNSAGNGSSGATGGGSGQGTINVALVNDITGGEKSTLGPAEAGMKAAVAEINATRGVNGRKMKIVGDFDSQSSTQGGQSATQQAIGTKPNAVLFGSSGVVLQAGLPALRQNNIFTLSDNAPGSAVVPPTQYPFLYGDSFTGDQGAAALWNEVAALDNGQAAKVAIIGLSDPAVDSVIDGLKKHAAAYNSSIVDVERTSLTQTSFTSQATNIASKGVDYIIILDSTPNTVLSTTALKTAGFKGKYVGTYGAADDTTLKKINNPDYVAYRPSHTEPDSEFVKAAIKYGASSTDTASPFFAPGYALVYAVKTAYEKCGSDCSIAGIQKVLESTSVEVPHDAVFGPLKFTAQSHGGLTSVQYYKYDPSSQSVVTTGSPIDLTDLK